MASRTRIPEELYLHSTFEPDAEFVRGEIAVRSLPDYLHSKIQGLLLIWFGRLMERHRVQPCPELRMHLSPGVYRVPDVALIAGPEPEMRFPDTPPFVTVEIVSLDDRNPDVIEKLEEYRKWGVPHIWLVDPHKNPEYNFEIPAQALSPASRYRGLLKKARQPLPVVTAQNATHSRERQRPGRIGEVMDQV